MATAVQEVEQALTSIGEAHSLSVVSVEVSELGTVTVMVEGKMGEQHARAREEMRRVSGFPWVEIQYINAPRPCMTPTVRLGEEP